MSWEEYERQLADVAAAGREALFRVREVNAALNHPDCPITRAEYLTAEGREKFHPWFMDLKVSYLTGPTREPKPALGGGWIVPPPPKPPGRGVW
jgi:hypothetical protein